jgi:beta-mannanase
LSEIRSLISEFNDQISASIQAYNTATNNLETIYEANTSASELLRETVENIEEPFALLQQEYESMRAQMETTIERMSDKMNDVLNAYFTQVQQQTTERMREWNNQTTQFSSAMVDVTNELNILVEKLQRNVKQV